MRSRIGLMMTKEGVTSVFFEGARCAATLLAFHGSRVVRIRNEGSAGVFSVILGYGDFKHLKRPQIGELRKLDIGCNFRLHESRLASENDLMDVSVGDEVGIRHFVIGQKVDVRGFSTGKGFCGVMKRHGFSGLPASHGVSRAARSMGSAGQCQDIGRVMKGKDMPGRHGSSGVSAQNLRVFDVLEESSLLVLLGNNVPGPAGAWVYVADSIKSGAFPGLIYPYVLAGSASSEGVS